MSAAACISSFPPPPMAATAAPAPAPETTIDVFVVANHTPVTAAADKRYSIVRCTVSRSRSLTSPRLSLLEFLVVFVIDPGRMQQLRGGRRRRRREDGEEAAGGGADAGVRAAGGRRGVRGEEGHREEGARQPRSFHLPRRVRVYVLYHHPSTFSSLAHLASLSSPLVVYKS